MARPKGTKPKRDGSSLLLWVAVAVLAAAVAIIGGFWVYAITTAEDMPLLLLVALLSIPTALIVLLIGAIRDRLVQKKRENFPEVDN